MAFLDVLHERRPAYEYITVVEEWTSASREKYLQRDAKEVRIYGGRRCDYLADLPDLLSVTIDTAMRDDSVLYGIETLVRLELPRRHRPPLQVNRLPNLKFLEIADREGKESVADHPNLRWLAINGQRDSSLRWLGILPEAEWISVDGQKNVLDLGRV